jgi:ribonuclease HII
MMLDDSLEPDFSFELAARAQGFSWVCGIDEAGRGPLAGPVVAAAVVLDPDNIPRGLNDSKKLDAETREALYGELVKSAKIGVGIGDHLRIDRDNILATTLWAMAEAVQNLNEAPHYALVDGNRAPKLSCGVQTIIAGDARCLSIAAASIIAKVTRDRIMVALHDEFPGYGFASHKGYGTPFHHAALNELGPCIHHRRSFAPVALLLAR